MYMFLRSFSNTDQQLVKAIFFLAGCMTWKIKHFLLLLLVLVDFHAKKKRFCWIDEPFDSLIFRWLKNLYDFLSFAPEEPDDPWRNSERQGGAGNSVAPGWERCGSSMALFDARRWVWQIIVSIGTDGTRPVGVIRLGLFFRGVFHESISLRRRTSGESAGRRSWRVRRRPGSFAEGWRTFAFPLSGSHFWRRLGLLYQQHSGVFAFRRWFYPLSHFWWCRSTLSMAHKSPKKPEVLWRMMIHCVTVRGGGNGIGRHVFHPILDTVQKLLIAVQSSER